MIYIDLLQNHSQVICQTFHQIVCQGTPRVQMFHLNGNGLSFSNPDNDRDAEGIIFFRQNQCVRTGLRYTTIG